MKLKTLELTNYSGYRQAVFDFTDSNGDVSPIGIFYGPNGCGKSTALHAMRILGNLGSVLNKDNSVFFRKMIFHPDYDPIMQHYVEHEHIMKMEAVFLDKNEEKRVIIDSSYEDESFQEDDPKRYHRIVLNEIGRRNITNFIDADHPINRLKFQLPNDGKKLFLEMARIVYGYNVWLDKPIEAYESNGDDYSGAGEQIDFWSDVIIDKGDAKVHFKTMSDGEKKIATLLRSLCDKSIMQDSDIILIDNIEMHVYFERHAKMIDKLIESFPDKQFLVTSHSGVMIEHVRKAYGESCLFNVPEIKGQEFVC